MLLFLSDTFKKIVLSVFVVGLAHEEKFKRLHKKSLIPWGNIYEFDDIFNFVKASFGENERYRLSAKDFVLDLDLAFEYFAIQYEICRVQ